MGMGTGARAHGSVDQVKKDWKIGLYGRLMNNAEFCRPDLIRRDDQGLP